MRKAALLLLLAALCACGSRPEKQSSTSSKDVPEYPFTIRLLPVLHDGENEIEESNVVLLITNASNQVQRIYRGWCSWGWWQFSFTAVDQQGNKYEITRRPQIWFANFPDVDVINPHEPMAYVLRMNDGSWEEVPQIPRQAMFKLTLHHIVDIVPPFKKRNMLRDPIWIGSHDTELGTVLFP